MHKFNIFISGPESFVSTFNELESYFKFNISSNQKKLSTQFINNLHGIIIHHDTSNNNQLKGILKNNNCLKILATNNNSVISKRIAEDLDLDFNEPLLEIALVSRNSTFIAKKSKTFEEEKKVAEKAPIDGIQIKDLKSKPKKKKEE